MPQLGETVTEGTIAVWHKQVGDTVKVDEILIDVETDKVATEIPAPVAGILSAIHVAEGETVNVGTVLAVIDTGKEEPVQKAESRPEKPEPATDTNPATPPSTERKSQSVRMSSVNSPLSPAVRRLLAEHNIDPSEIAGTGRNGRIKRSDVLAWLEKPAQVHTGGNQRATTGPADETWIPFSLKRRVIAEHMVRSKSVSPHVLQAVEVDFSKVDQARAQHGGKWKAKYGFSLTYLPFIARAVCQAIRDFPHLNASIEGQGMRLHPHVNLAIAVDLGDDGLVAPVIRTAENLSVTGLAEKINAIAGLARDAKIKADDLAGGTYTISNSGSFGTLITAPVINQPQLAILSTDGVKKRPVVISGPEGDSIAIRPVGILAQSFDHRAIDGAYSAGFLRKVQSILEATDWVREI